MSHTHRYSLAGSYSIAFSVTDDDGGADTESTLVRVLTPEQAVATTPIALLEQVVAALSAG